MKYVGNFETPRPIKRIYQTESLGLETFKRSHSFSSFSGSEVYDSVPEEHLKALTMLALSHETPSENYLPVEGDDASARQWDDVYTIESNSIAYDPTGVWQIADSIVHRVYVDGKEKYAVDGFIIPRLAIGENGRIELKASLTQILKGKSCLRHQTNALSTLKGASIGQLLAMAKCCGIWDKVERISNWYSSKQTIHC